MRVPHFGCILWLLSLLANVRAFGESPGDRKVANHLVNGVYSIVRQCCSQDEVGVLGEHQQAVPMAANDDHPNRAHKVVVVLDMPKLTLDLVGEPQVVAKPNGAQVLNVELKGTQMVKLYETTKSNLNQLVAIVVNDQVVMTPKIRAPITDGKMEISVCRGDVSRLKSWLWPSAQEQARP